MRVLWLNTWTARLVVVALAISVAGWFGYSRLVASTPRSELRTATVQRSNVTQTATVSGSVNPASSLKLSFKTTGRLAEVFVTVGQLVNAGDRLGRLDDTDQRVALDQANANLVSALAKYNATLAGDDVASLRLSVDNAQRTLDRLLANYAAAKGNLDTLYGKAMAERATAQLAFFEAQSVLATLQTDLPAAPLSADVKNAVSLANTVQANLQQAQVQLTLFDGAAFDLATATSALKEQVARADGGNPDAQAYAVAQAGQAAALSRTQSAADAANTQLGTAASNVNSIIASLNTAVTKPDAGLDLPRADATTLAQRVGTVQQRLVGTKSTLGALTGTVSTISDAIIGSSIVSAQNSLATAKQSLQAKLSSRDTDLQAARAAVDGARASVDNAQNALANLTLTAPAPGVVAQINGQVGEFVATSTSASANPFIALSNTAALALHGTVGEADVAKLKLGQVATITIDALGTEKRFTGRVSALDPVASIQQGVPVYGVDVSLDVSDAAIRPGMSGTANVILASKRDVLVVPNLALRNLGGRRGVQLLRDGQTLDLTDLRFGIANEQVTEVMEGLAEGDTVVLPTPRAGSTPAAPGGFRVGGPSLTGGPGAAPGGLGR